MYRNKDKLFDGWQTIDTAVHNNAVIAIQKRVKTYIVHYNNNDAECVKRETGEVRYEIIADGE